MKYGLGKLVLESMTPEDILPHCKRLGVEMVQLHPADASACHTLPWGCRSGEVRRLMWRDVKRDRLVLAESRTGPLEAPLEHGAAVDVRVDDAQLRRAVVALSRRRCHLEPIGFLTCMSIHDSLHDAVARGLPIPVEPTMPSEPMVRALYASPTVHRLITGPWADKEEETRCGRLWADFDRFVEGRVIPVALNSPYGKPRDTYLSRLDPAEDEVWEIRSRAPRPAIRVFGRFADRDCFVALGWRRRKELRGAGSREFREEVRSCLAAWRRTFPSYDAFKGDTADEYISERAFPV